MTFTYDFAGRRIMSRLDSNVKKFYIFDGDTMIGEAQGNNTATVAYTWGANGPIAQRKITTSQSLWYDFGPQGETRHLTNSTGAIADTFLYTSYGVKTVSVGPDPTGLLFGGQFGGYYSDFNTNAGVIYCRNRWYHPRLGRWISRDPAGYNGGPNLYEYCKGNPIGLVDPLGLMDRPANPAGHKYGSEAEAAVAALQYWYPRSQQQGREIGGYIVKVPGKPLPKGATGPPNRPTYEVCATVMTGEATGLTQWSDFVVPIGAVAWFHTHPYTEPSDQYDFFSSNDRNICVGIGGGKGQGTMRGYMGSYRAVWVFDPADRTFFTNGTQYLVHITEAWLGASLPTFEPYKKR